MPSAPERPSFIGHYTDFMEEDNCHYQGSEELLAIGSPVGKMLGLRKIGVHVETLPPGRRTSFPHAESDEEEFAFVLEGAPSVWIDGVLHPLVAGDFVAFPSGTGIAHTFINDSDAVARLLVGGESAKKGVNRIFYPLNPEQNEIRRQRGDLWEDCPWERRGDHDGRPVSSRAPADGAGSPGR